VRQFTITAQFFDKEKQIGIKSLFSFIICCSAVCD